MEAHKGNAIQMSTGSQGIRLLLLLFFSSNFAANRTDRKFNLFISDRISEEDDKKHNNNKRLSNWGKRPAKQNQFIPIIWPESA